MGSKKERTDRKLQKLITPEQKTHSVAPSVQISHKPTIQAKSTTPFYTALIMIAAMVVLYFIFTVILNTVIADMCLSADSSLNGNNEALLAATEQFIVDHPIYNIISSAFISISGILAMMMTFYRLEKCEITSVGLFKTATTKTDIGMGLLIGFVSAAVVYNLLFLFGFVKPTGAFVFNYYQIAWTFHILFTIVFEEILFRGYVMFKFPGKNGFVGIIISGVAFALYKGVPSIMPSTYITYFIFGAMLAYSVKMFHSVWFALSFRLIWTFFNAIIFSVDSAVILGIVENSGLTESFLSGSRAGCENGIIAGAIFVLCFILIRYLNKKRSEPKIRKIHRDGTIH